MPDRKQPSLHPDESGPAADILSTVHVGIYLTQKNKIVHVNPAYARLTGYSADDLIGTDPLQYVHPEDRTLLDQTAQRILNDEHPGPLDIRLATENGNGIRVLAHLHPFLYRKRKAVLVSLTDITLQPRGEENTSGLADRHRSIFEDLQEVYFETDLHGNITFSNNALCRHLGYTKEELQGMNNRQYTDEESSKKIYEAFHELYLTGKPIKAMEETIIRKDGTRGTAELSASLIRDHAGRPIGFAGISREITERKRMEESLRESEEKYRTIIETIEDGYVEVDLTGTWTFVNDVICRHMGYARQEIIGMDFHKLLTEKSARDAVKAFAEVYQTGTALKSFETEGLRKDGSVGNYELSVSLIRDSNGQAVGFRCISRDITERKKLENELRQSEERYRTIINETNEWYFETDVNGSLLFFNEALARTLGHDTENMSGMNFRKLIGEHNANAIYTLFYQVFETGHPVRNASYQFIHPDGSIILAELSIFPRRDQKGRVAGFRAVGRDITEKKKAQQQQMLSEKMTSIGQIAAGAAQRISHPTFFVSSNLKTLSEYSGDIDDIIRMAQSLPEFVADEDPSAINALNQRLTEIKQLARKVKIDFILEDLDSLIKESQESMEQIIRIVRDLETYGNTGDVPLKPDDINQNMETALNHTWNELKYKAVIIRDYGDLPKIHCRPQQINQVFINLLLNAGQAIEDDGEIKISTSDDRKGHIEIRIQDNGTGIPEENLSRIFDPFFTTKTPDKATGLGLHAAFSIIDRHHGKIEVESKPGKGTTFIITLPVTSVANR